MKQRFSSLDVKVIVHELNATLVSLRVSNIYDLSTRIFLLKFQKPNVKEQLMIDSGFRCHLTSFNRATAAAPSPFVQKLRKCLKTRRVTKVSQVGTDRIIEIEFSDGLWKLFLEFFAGGNIVLTDNELNVVALLRNVNEGAEHERLRLGVKYDLQNRQNIGGVPDLTRDRLKDGLQRAVDRQQAAGEEDASSIKKNKKKAKDALRRSLATCINEFPPILVDHAMTVKQFDSTIKPEEVLSSEDLLDKLLESLKEAQRVVAEITASDTVKGYILAKDKSKAVPTENLGDAENETASKNLLYEDFHPFRPAQFENDPQTSFVEFDGFNKTVDEFFSSIEGQKLESRLHEREAMAQKRLEMARSEHDKRIGGLQQAQELNIQKAEAILANVERVQEAQAAVNGLIGQGMDWVDIARLIEAEQSRGNAVAQMVKLPLKLHENTVTLLLGAAEEQGNDDDSGYFDSDSESAASESEDEDMSAQTAKKPAEEQRMAIDVDLALTPWANASQYYDQKKSAAVKETKTVQASNQALKSAERKIAADLKKGLDQEKEILRPVRKQFWFEKFYYFISSDGYLVLGGKDAQQNELLYRRHLRKGDVYVHADLNGAASVVIKNNPATPDAPIPPSTLSQAGTFSVTTSSAWDSKAVMSAYWVNADQVSKTAPTGEYLTTGGFMVRGKKNYLPPAQLLLGFAIMWQISEESKANHRKHRIDGTASLEGSVADLSVQDEPGEEKPIPTHEAANSAEKPDIEDDDSEEDFPDVSIDAQHADSDDEDFPDAKLDRPVSDDESDSEDEQGNVAHKANPLQTMSAPAVEAEDDEASSMEGEDEGQVETHTPSAATSKPQQRHLTAQERAALRSGKVPHANGEDTISKNGTSTPKQKGPQPAPRGKRGKAKKAAQKYADQDPEDRELAMRLLGSKIGQDAAAEAIEEKKAKQEEEERQKQRRREQHQRTQEEGKAAEARRVARLEGTATEEDDEADAELMMKEVGLDGFTGRPLAGDELLAALPVCAPWNALASYKYKIKLQPGTVKKGKAVGQILDSWQRDGKDTKKVDRNSEDTEKMWPREVELVRGMKGPEVVGVIPVKGMKAMLSTGGDSKKGGGSGGSGKKVGGKSGGGKGGKGKKK